MSEAKLNFIRRNPNFLKLWAGQVLSQSGGRMAQIAILWWILSTAIDRSGIWIGSFMVMVALPPLLLAQQIGKWVDNYHSKRILVSADSCAAVLWLLATFALPHFTPLWILPLGLTASLFQGFIDPTLNKSIVEVVPPQDVESGVAFIASTQSLANFAGAILGAMLIGACGISGTLALAALAYLISAYCSSLVVFKKVSLECQEGSLSQSGWELLSQFPFQKKILLGFGLINFFGSPTLVILPIYVKKVLMGDAKLLGSLEALLWLGLLMGAYVARYIPANNGRVKTGAACLILFGVCLFIPGLKANHWIYGSLLFLAGSFLGINNVKFMTFFQETVPASVKGSFFALMQALISFSFPIAYFLFGALTDILPVQTVCLIQGVGVLLLAIYMLRLSKEEPPLETLGAPQTINERLAYD